VVLPGAVVFHILRLRNQTAYAVHFSKEDLLMIKKTFVFLALVLALGFGMVGTGHVQAVSGLTFQSGVQVVNLDTNNVANITLDYYDQATGTKTLSVPDTIAKGGSKTYFPIGGLPSGFNGSLVISSDVPVVSIANTITNDGMYIDTNASFSAGSTTFYLPLVMCSNSGFDTFFNVQNAGGSDATITIAYNPNGTGTGATGKSESATIKPGAAKTFDQSLGSSTVNCSTLKDPVTGKFVGSGTITSNVPVVASVMQLNTTNFKVLMAYNGFAQGSQTVGLPLIMANNSGYYTGIQIQNVGSSPTDVTITYNANTGGSFAPVPEQCLGLAAGKSCTLLQATGQWVGAGKKYVGSATVTNSASQPLVAIVNQVFNGNAGAGPFGSSYQGVDPNAATAATIMPLIMANNSGYYTGYQVMNVGTGSCNVAVTYGPNTNGTFAPVAESFTLAPLTSKTVLQAGTSPSNGSANNWATAGRYVGSGDVVGTGAGCKIATIVNQVVGAVGDHFSTYNAFSH
jgi:hypothetical protein